MKDPDDITIYRKSIERTRVHVFLTGLDKSFDKLRQEILRREPLFSLEEYHSLVFREAIRYTTFNEDIEKHKASIMVSRHRPSHRSQDRPGATNPKNSNSSNKLKCTNYNQTGHSKSHFFELIRYLEW